MTDDTARMAVFEPYGPAWNAKHCKQSRHQRLQNAVDEIRALCANPYHYDDGKVVFASEILAVLERLEERQ